LKLGPGCLPLHNWGSGCKRSQSTGIYPGPRLALRSHNLSRKRTNLRQILCDEWLSDPAHAGCCTLRKVKKAREMPDSERSKMPLRPQLTERDQEIIFTLTHHVRVLTVPQIARTWWKSSKESAGCAVARVKILQRENLLLVDRVPAHPELPMSAPTISWEPGQQPPNFGRCSYRLQSRWKLHPVMTICVSGSRAAARRFGGFGGRLPRQVERTHDIHLAGVYLYYREHFPERLHGWVFEESLRQIHRTGEPLPDVVLEHEGHRKIIEFGGAYPKAKLQHLHAFLENETLPYEVW
jgi:hypothetical protein